MLEFSLHAKIGASSMLRKVEGRSKRIITWKWAHLRQVKPVESHQSAMLHSAQEAI